MPRFRFDRPWRAIWRVATSDYLLGGVLLGIAIALFLEAAGADPGYVDTYNNLGFAYYLRGDVSLAEKYFKKALELDPGNAKAADNLRFMAEQKK